MHRSAQKRSPLDFIASSQLISHHRALCYKIYSNDMHNISSSKSDTQLLYRFAPFIFHTLNSEIRLNSIKRKCFSSLIENALFHPYKSNRLRQIRVVTTVYFDIHLKHVDRIWRTICIYFFLSRLLVHISRNKFWSLATC